MVDMIGGNIRIDPLKTGAWAKLYLYSPRLYGTHVLRPFVYGFTEDTTNFLLGKGDNLSGAFNRKDVKLNDRMAGIIRPAAQGVEMDMGTYNCCWTFVLLIHQPRNMNSGLMSATNSTLYTFRGVCGEEPISFLFGNQTLNERCPLIVHSREIVRENPKTVNAFGMNGTMDVYGNADVVDAQLNQCSKQGDLFVMTPKDVLENYNQKDGFDVAMTPGLCAVSNERKSVDSTLKSPGLHLKQIFQGIDASTEEAVSGEYAPHGVDDFSGAMSPATDVAQFKETVINQLSLMCSGADVNSVIDLTTIPCIADIKMAYQDFDVIPIKIDQNPNMEILPQDYNSKRANYSSFATSAISSIASTCGLQSIGFTYWSYDPAKAGELDKSSFQVVPSYTMLTHVPTDKDAYDRTLIGAVNKFKKRLADELTPFIKGVCGDFMMEGIYDGNAETKINLQFLDDTRSTNGTGWFESANRLSALGSTSVGTQESFSNNGHALNAFVLQVQGKTQQNALGITAFDRPNIDFGSEAPSMSSLAGVFG